MSNQVQAQREYAPLTTPKISGLVRSIGEDIQANSISSTPNIENLLSSCQNWYNELEQEITNLIDRLGPVLRPDRPSDPSNIPGEKKLIAPMSTVACRLETLSSRIMEQTRRLLTIKDLIDL